MSQEFIRVPVVLKTPAEEKQQINHKISFIKQKKKEREKDKDNSLSPELDSFLKPAL